MMAAAVVSMCQSFDCHNCLIILINLFGIDSELYIKIDILKFHY